MVMSGVLAVVIVAVGIGLTTAIDVRVRPEERLFLGVVVGVVAVAATSFVAFTAVGMGWITLAIGVGAPGTAAALGAYRHHHTLGLDARRAWRRLRLPSRRAASLRPLAALTVATGAVSTRVLALAYQSTDRGISAGSLAVWGDWSAHLAYAGSFAYGDNRSLQQPLAAGTPLRYHVLSNFFGSLFTVTGATLTQSLVISAWLVALAFPPLMFCFVLRLTGSRLTSAISVLLFTLTGGVGAWYFLVDVRASGWHILSDLPQTYARMPDHELWVDNTISASLYAQRSTLLGVTIAMAAGVLLLAARPRWSRGGFVAAGLLVGASGIAHVHLLLTALALGALAAIFDRRRVWCWFLGPAATIGLPLAWAIRPPTNSMRWLIGWMAPGAHQSWIVFWLRNAGALLPLFIGIAVLGGVAPRLRRLSAPLWLWFIVPNLVSFHPSEWNNTKFFLFWQFGACVVIAAFVRRLAIVRRDRPIAKGGIGPRTAAGMMIVAASAIFATLTVTGSLDTVRAMQRSSAIAWVDADDVAGAHWLRDHASPGDRLVYGADNTSAIAALSGVPALSAYPGWTADLGLVDWSERLEATRAILSGAADAAADIARYGIDYVAIGPRERTEFSASDQYWRAHGTLVFSQGEYSVYRV